MPPRQFTPSQDSIERVLAGEATPDEQHRVQQWIASDPRRAATVDALKTLDRAGAGAAGQASAQALSHRWAEISAIIQAVGPLDPARRVRPRQRSSVSGAEVAPLGDQLAPRRQTLPKGEPLGMRTLRSGRQKLRQRETQHFPPRFWMVATLAAVVVLLIMTYRHTSIATSTQRYSTTAGQRSTVHLASGSTMILAPSTSVSITSEGAKVTGEAYFTIAPHPTRPFIVQTRNAVVRVLGTMFSVRQYPTELASRVMVVDGRVAIQSVTPRHTEASTVLSARMVGRVQDSTIAVRSNIAVDEYAGWTHGRLVFNRTPLQNVVNELSRTYGTGIRVEDSTLAGTLVTMQVTFAEQPLTQVLDFLSIITDSHYTRVGNALVLRPGHRNLNVTPSTKHIPQLELQYGR